MKRIIYIILAATAAFTACKKDESAKINDCLLYTSDAADD